jgi:hypothetical protein
MLFALIALTSAACKDKPKTETKAETKTGEGSAEAPTGASGACPDGFRHQPKGGFCIKLPASVKGDGGAGMAVGKNQTQFGWAGGEKGSDFGVTVQVWALSEHYDDNLQRAMKNPPYQGKVLGEGKIGETGGWGYGESGPPPAGYAQRRYINSMIKNDKMQLSCNVSRASGNGPPTEDEVFEACKTITFAK